MFSEKACVLTTRSKAELWSHHLRRELSCCIARERIEAISKQTELDSSIFRDQVQSSGMVRFKKSQGRSNSLSCPVPCYRNPIDSLGHQGAFDLANSFFVCLFVVFLHKWEVRKSTSYLRSLLQFGSAGIFCVVIGVVNGFNFLLLRSVRVILALLVTEINFPFGTFCMQPGWVFFLMET